MFVLVNLFYSLIAIQKWYAFNLSQDKTGFTNIFQPVDCLQFGALEMLESPDVAIVQHASGVMQVVHNLFENASMCHIHIITI
jgi:hypothetical protein